MGDRYVTGLKERNLEAARITDKMPANFNCLGLIHLMLPQAKIVHIKRNPVDTCLSNFTKLFGHKAQPQSYDLAEIGRYYRNYARLMEHWRQQKPDVMIVDFRLAADVDGLQVIAHLNQCANADIPALLLTGDTALDVLQVIKMSGVSFLNKPVASKDLIQRLADILGGCSTRI